MKTASDLADWWEEQRRYSTQWAARGLDEFVDAHPGMVSVVLATTGRTLFEFPMVVGSGFVDVLNLGKGAAEGGWGYAQDGLRLLSAVGPLAKGGRVLLSRVVALADANLPNCTWMAAVKALRETGTRHFATLEDLLKAAGLNTAAESGGAFVHEVTVFLQRLGARVHNLPQPGSLQDVIKTAKANPDSVVMFSIEWADAAHTVLARYNPLRGVMFADRTGAVVKSLADLARYYGQGIANAVPSGSMAVIEAARLVKALNAGSLLSQIGLEVMAVMTPGAKEALGPAGSGGKPPLAPPGGRKIIATHTVVAQDWLSKLAVRYYNDMTLWPVINDYNAATIGPDYNNLKPGQRLAIPDLSSYTRAELDEARRRARQWAPSAVRRISVAAPR